MLPSDAYAYTNFLDINLSPNSTPKTQVSSLSVWTAETRVPDELCDPTISQEVSKVRMTAVSSCNNSSRNKDDVYSVFNLKMCIFLLK